MSPDSFPPVRAGLCAAALVLAILAVAPAGAQDAAAPATSPPAAIPSVPSLPEPSPSQLAAARDVVTSSGMSRSFEPMEPELEGQIIPLMTRTRPELVADLRDVLTQLHPEFVKDAGEMTDIASRIYAQQMSEADLQAAAAFFNSSAGKQYVKVQPIMLDQLVVQMQSWTQKLSNTMMLRVRQEMVKKGHADF